MKLGLGLYRQLLTPENLRFARQAGVSHIVAHLVEYLQSGPWIPSSRGDEAAWGRTHRVGRPWTLAEIEEVRGRVEAEGLVLHAIENFDPGHWHDVLLGGPRYQEQLEQVLDHIRLVGEAGIPYIGYNFSLAGVWGHRTGAFARGGATSVAVDLEEIGEQPEIPRGQVWNMTYDPDAGDATLGVVGADEMWSRAEAFLAAAVPVAEKAGVRLCAHPDDPPVPELRGTGRLLHDPAGMQRFIDVVHSDSNRLVFCQGTVSEMRDADVYQTIDRFARQNRIGYVHFRNVVGRIPSYREVFVDEGDVDMVRALKTYADAGFDGVFIPDHSPQMAGPAPWHTGMAFALGYMRGAMQAVEKM